VQVVGRTHDHPVEVPTPHELLPPGLDGRPGATRRGYLLGEHSGPRGVAATERDDLHARVAQERGQVHALHPPTGADDGETGG
jgi:hypothetical protein